MQSMCTARSHGRAPVKECGNRARFVAVGILLTVAIWTVRDAGIVSAAGGSPGSVASPAITAGSPFPPEHAASSNDGIIPVCTAPGTQQAVQIIADGAGGAFVTWEDDRSGTAQVYVHHVLATGVVDPLWPVDGKALCPATGAQTHCRSVPDGAGGAIVTWQDERSGSGDIYAQHLLASGELDTRWPIQGLPLCVATGQQRFPVITTDGACGAIVAWIDHRSTPTGPNHDLYAQHVLAAGIVNPSWPADGRAVCNTHTVAEDLIIGVVKGEISIVTDGSGGALFQWEDSRFRNDPGNPFNYGSSIYAQRVLASGVVDPAWPAGGVLVSSGGSGGLRRAPVAVPNGMGGAVIAFRFSLYRFGEHEPGLTSITATGEVGSTVRIGLGPASPHVMTSDLSGGGYLAWLGRPYADYNEMALRLFHVLPSGEMDPDWPPGGAFVTEFHGSRPAVALEGMGGVLVAWEDTRSAPSPQVYVQHVLGTGEVDVTCPVNGRNVSEGAGSAPQIVGDGTGGGIVVWEDGDIHAVRLLGPLPTVVMVSLVGADATAERVRLVWSVGGGPGRAATVYRRTPQSPWAPRGEALADGSARVAFEDREVAAGTRYGYRLGIVDGREEVFGGEVWIAVPAPDAALSLAGARPNPSVEGRLQVEFTLGDDTDGRLDLLDIAGRLVLSQPVRGLGAGRHVLDFGEAPRLEAGIYFLRLVQGRQEVRARVAVVR